MGNKQKSRARGRQTSAEARKWFLPAVGAVAVAVLGGFGASWGWDQYNRWRNPVKPNAYYVSHSELFAVDLAFELANDAKLIERITLKLKDQPKDGCYPTLDHSRVSFTSDCAYAIENAIDEAKEGLGAEQLNKAQVLWKTVDGIKIRETRYNFGGGVDLGLEVKVDVENAGETGGLLDATAKLKSKKKDYPGLDLTAPPGTIRELKGKSTIAPPPVFQAWKVGVSDWLKIKSGIKNYDFILTVDKLSVRAKNMPDNL